MKIRKENDQMGLVQKSPLKSVKIRPRNAEIPSSARKPVFIRYDLINATLSKLI